MSVRDGCQLDQCLPQEAAWGPCRGLISDSEIELASCWCGQGAQAIVSCGSFLLEWIPSARSRTWADPRARVCRIHRHHHHSPSSVTLRTCTVTFTLSAARHCSARDCIVSGRRPFLATHCLFCSLLCSRPTLAPSKLPHRADAPHSSEGSLSSTAVCSYTTRTRTMI
jgi:hypothetical protein